VIFSGNKEGLPNFHFPRPLGWSPDRKICKKEEGKNQNDHDKAKIRGLNYTKNAANLKIFFWKILRWGLSGFFEIEAVAYP
jgi:hypothetical protein